MKKFFALCTLSMLFSYASFAIYPMTPSSGGACIGYSLYLRDSLSPGGTWSSSNPAVASIGSTSGILLGVSSGVVTITYTLSSTSVYGTFTVSPSPAAVTGGGTAFCPGATTTLSDATSGGSWSSSAPGVATVGSSTGIVTGVGGGLAAIYYTLGGGCAASLIVSVDATPVPAIAGPYTVCAGSTMTLIDSMGTGGTWSSSSTGIATVGVSTGIVTGVSGGTVTITLTATGPCGSAFTTQTITVLTTTSVGTISGASSMAVGASAMLSETVGGGTWTSATTSIATIGSSSGLVSGVAVGSTPITYTVIGCGGSAYTTTTVSVTAFDGISGHVNLGSGPYYGGDIKVWLITYNPTSHDLEAYDSATYSGGGSVYYQFTGIPTDSYRVKAAVIDTFSFSTGYIPTYHTSYFYWYSADVINHTSGTGDINEDINMSYGTTTTGPGFIAGDVYTGANRSTAGGIPAVGLHMYVVNSTSGQLIQQAITNGSGHYSFTSLPVGQTYYVFPDSLNFLTTAYTSITLTTANPGMATAGFTQHTLSRTITPVLESVKPVTAVTPSIFAFPNPANNTLNIQWTEKNAETASVMITDIAGREVYSSSITMNQGTGVNQIDLSEFVNGTYLITVKTGTITYNNKLQIQH